MLEDTANFSSRFRLWEGSWADDAVSPDPENDSYADPGKVRTINHKGQYFDISAKHLVDPTPQRTPLIFQAGSSSAGSSFAATHAEGVFVSSHSPRLVRESVDKIRHLAAEKGRDPRSLKFFSTFTPILGHTDEEAQAKYEEIQKYSSSIGGLVLFSGWTGIDISQIPIDQVTAADSLQTEKITSFLDWFSTTSDRVSEWTPRNVAKIASFGGFGPVSVGSPQTVADEMERWIREADVDGFNITHTTTPGTYVDVVNLLIPELRRRGIYPEPDQERLTFRERFYGKGTRRLRADHPGSKYKYDVYEEDVAK